MLRIAGSWRFHQSAETKLETVLRAWATADKRFRAISLRRSKSQICVDFLYVAEAANGDERSEFERFAETRSSALRAAIGSAFISADVSSSSWLAMND